jgi:hypothetical protein
VKNEEKRGRGLFSPFSGKVEKWNSGKNEEKRDNSFSRLEINFELKLGF